MGSHSFTCHPHTNPYLQLLPPTAVMASPPFGWYSLRLPTKGRPGWVDLGGWSHTKINVPHREMNPESVTHPSTNRARRSRPTRYRYTPDTTVFYDARVINSVQNVNVVLSIFISVFSFIFLSFFLVYLLFLHLLFLLCPCLPPCRKATILLSASAIANLIIPNNSISTT